MAATIGPKPRLSQAIVPGGPITAEWDNHEDAEDLAIELQVSINGVLQEPTTTLAGPRTMDDPETYELPTLGFSHDRMIGVRMRYEGTQWGMFTIFRWHNALIEGPGFTDGSALQYFDADAERLTQNVGPEGSLTRDSARWEWDGRSASERPPHSPVPWLITRHDGTRKKGIRLGGLTEQLLDLPFDFDLGDWDDFASGVTLTPVTSLFREKTAQRISGDSSDYIEHEIAGTAAGTRTLTAVVREFDAPTCKFRVYDEDATAYICSIDFDLATGECTVTGVGTAWAVPWGDEGRAWKVGLTFAQPSAHELWAQFWPNSGAGTKATDLHHLGVPTGTAAAIVSGPQNTSAEADALSFPSSPCASHVRAHRLSAGELSTKQFKHLFGGESGEYPRFELYRDASKLGCRYVIDVSTSVVSEVDAPVWTETDDVETFSVLEFGLVEATEVIRVRFGVRVNGGTALAGEVDEEEESHPTAWGGDGKARFPDEASPVDVVLDCTYSVKLADCCTPALEGDAGTLLEELSGFALGLHGDVLKVTRPEQPPLADPPDAVGLAVAYFLARADRTITFHARTEAVRREMATEDVVAADVIPDAGANGRYFAQSDSDDRPDLRHDDTRFILRAIAKWMEIFESDDSPSTNGDLFNVAGTGSIIFVLKGTPTGVWSANPIIGNADCHLYLDGDGFIGYQVGGSHVRVDYANGMVYGVFRSGSGDRRIQTDVEAEATAGGVSGAGSGDVAQLFRRDDDDEIAANVDLVFLQTETARVADVDIADVLANLAVIRE